MKTIIFALITSIGLAAQAESYTGTITNYDRDGKVLLQYKMETQVVHVSDSKRVEYYVEHLPNRDLKTRCDIAIDDVNGNRLLTYACVDEDGVKSSITKTCVLATCTGTFAGYPLSERSTLNERRVNISLFKGSSPPPAGAVLQQEISKLLVK